MNLSDIVPKPRYNSLDELIEMIQNFDHPPFKPSVFYNETGDMLEVFLLDDPYYVQHLKGGIDAKVSFDSGMIVGFVVNNFRKKIERDSRELWQVLSSKVDLSGI